MNIKKKNFARVTCWFLYLHYLHALRMLGFSLIHFSLMLWLPSEPLPALLPLVAQAGPSLPQIYQAGLWEEEFREF